MPSVGGVSIPASEVETKSEMTSILSKADPALFRIPADYKPAEFPMTPQRMLSYLGLPSAVLQ
jgi:hypothetical protein